MANRYDLVAGIQYDSSQGDAPTVVLKGECEVSDRVVALAKRYGIPVIEDAHLAQAIQGVPLDTQIPEQLYRAVAVVLNHIEAVISRATQGRLPRRLGAVFGPR